MNKNKNANGVNLESSLHGTWSPQTIGGAKIQINIETAKQELQKLKEKYQGVCDPKGFLSDLRVACGIPNNDKSSKYGIVEIPSADGKIMRCSLRLSNHHPKARTYIEKNANCDYNLSLAIRRRTINGKFEPHPDVQLGHYAYPGYRLEKVDNPLVKI